MTTRNQTADDVLPARISRFTQAALGGLGGALAIAALATLAQLVNQPLLIAPFGASCVLLFGVPESPFAQPRNLIFGHLLSTSIGLAVFAAFGGGIASMAMSVGLAIAVMHFTRCVHPPAGADPLVIMLSGNASIGFLFLPVGAGVCVLLVAALIFSNGVRRSPWPVRRH